MMAFNNKEHRQKLEIKDPHRVQFNAWAKRIVKYIGPAGELNNRVKRDFPLPDPHISATIDFEDVKDLTLGHVDTYGNRVSRYFEMDQRLVGLEGHGYQGLLKLVKSMHSIPLLNRYLSLDLIEGSVFEWLENYYLGRTRKDMMDSVLPDFQKSIRLNEIWIPVPHVITTNTILIGKIALRTITKTLIDQWETDWKRHNSEDSEGIQHLFTKYRKRYQGRAAAFLLIEAEENRAKQIAFTEAKRSISVLRYFDPALQDPHIASHCELDGRYLIPKSFSISTKNERRPTFHEGVHGRPPIPWKLTPPYLSVIKSNGLDILSRILASDDRISFQEDVLNAILIYSRSALESETVDKLIYIFAALESILLRKGERNISQNVRERMAVHIGDSLKDSKMLVSDFKKAYSVRSDFLHHGLKREEERIVRRFMANTWLLFYKVLLDIDKYQNKNEFIQVLDERKLTPK